VKELKLGQMLIGQLFNVFRMSNEDTEKQQISETNETTKRTSVENLKEEENVQTQTEKKKPNLGNILKKQRTQSLGGEEDLVMETENPQGGNSVPSTPLSDLLKRSKQKPVVETVKQEIEEEEEDELENEKYLYFKTKIEDKEELKHLETLSHLELEECQINVIQVESEIIEPFVKDCLHLFSGKWNVLKRGSPFDCLDKKEVKQKKILKKKEKFHEKRTF
jgi:hypothetical protein